MSARRLMLPDAWRRRTLLALGVLGASGLRAGTPGIDQPPLPGPPRPLALPPLDEQRLPNGLTLVVAPRPGLPLVSAALAWRGGADADPPGRAGLAGATAALLARGALRAGQPVGASALARQAEALGAKLDSDSGWRAASVAMTVATPRLDAALALIADVVRRPLFQVDELASWRLQALDDLQLARADPSAVAAQVARRLHWGGSPYGAVVTAASLRRLQRADLQGFHRRAARPEQALLVLAGDVIPAHALALARRLLGDWSPRGGVTAAGDATPAAPLPVRQVWVDMPGAGQCSVMLAAPWAALGDADLRAAQVASAVLGGGYSSRLNQQIRIRRGLSYGVFGDGEAYPAGGWWTASAQTDHRNAAEVLQLLRDELQRLADAAPAADELAARQAALVGGFARRWDTSAGMAGLLTGHWLSGRPWAALADYADEVMAVTPAQVREVASRHWRPAGLHAVVVGDLQAVGDTLPAASDDTWRLALEQLDFDRPALRAAVR